MHVIDNMWYGSYVLHNARYRLSSVLSLPTVNANTKEIQLEAFTSTQVIQRAHSHHAVVIFHERLKTGTCSNGLLSREILCLMRVRCITSLIGT